MAQHPPPAYDLQRSEGNVGANAENSHGGVGESSHHNR
eukprot:CAMPEP_0113527190 /NCGR_PEP_ID=MMETSP0015_2-20120614/1159_1 /TAXON_ID=2838 /ORGANISM="Odontella" /LENGTH=37 /DNA_ID=CAMNT_0000425599 /DNA_START=617 /DNA_END=726 /DNA_ORIENTATION=+ /assembly_acc=CAM_ASM_000160